MVACINVLAHFRCVLNKMNIFCICSDKRSSVKEVVHLIVFIMYPPVEHRCFMFVLLHTLKCEIVMLQELEDALLVDHMPDPSSLLVEIHSVFLTGILGKPVT